MNQKAGEKNSTVKTIPKKSEISEKQKRFWSVLIENNAPLTLTLLSAVLFFCYFFFGFIIPQTPGRITRPSFDLINDLSLWSVVTSLPIPIPQQSEWVAVLLFAISLIAFIAYGFAIYLSWKYQRGRKIILSSAVIFFFMSIWFLPNINTDIYNYIMRGRQVAIYDSNPYYVPADKFSDDPIYSYASHKYTFEPGGKLPAWMHINAFLAKIGGDNVVNNLLLYRFAFFLFNLANLGLILLILKKLNPRYVLPAVVMYSWNPIVVLFGQSKTDTVMIFYLLLAIWLLVSERKKLTAVAMSLSVFVKLITLPLFIVYLLRDIKLRRWKDFFISSTIFVVTAMVIYFPFWEGSSLLFHHLGALGQGGAAAPGIIRYLLGAAFAMTILWSGLTQNGSLDKLLRGWAVVMLFFSLFLTKLGLAWYLITLIVVVSFNFNVALTLTMIVLSFSSFLFNTWYSTFTGNFKVDELFALPKLIVYSALPILSLIGVAAVTKYRKFAQRKSITMKANNLSNKIPGPGMNGKDQQLLRVLAYHRVDKHKRTPHLDPRLISATPACFSEHMKHLANHYTVVSMEQILETVEGGKRVPEGAVLITFDDAYRDFKEVALPILKQYGLPATVFVATAYPDNNDRKFWWDKLYSSVMHTSHTQLNSTPIGSLTLKSKEDRKQSLRRLQLFLKTLQHSDSMVMVDEICKNLGNGRELENGVLGWDELRQLSKENVTLAAHTQTHPLLTQLPIEEVRKEVVGSFEDLKREIGDVLPVFSYPNGSHDDKIVEMMKQENFVLAFTVNDGHNDLNTANLLKLRRTNITRRSIPAIFRLRLKSWFTYVDKLRHRQRQQISHF